MSFLKTVDAARARRLENATPCDARDIATTNADPVAMSQVSQDMSASCEAEAQLCPFFEERAAIREYDGGLSRPEAEAGALRETIAHWLARNPLSPSVPGGGLHLGAEFGLTRDEGKHRETVIQELAPIADCPPRGGGFKR